MTDKQIEKMLSDVVNEIDYDIWKEYFLHEDKDLEPGDPSRKEILIEVARDHIVATSKSSKKKKGKKPK